MYAQGQEHFVIEEGRQTPTEKYKTMLMDVLRQCIELDIPSKEEDFIRRVDQLHNLMRLYSIHRIEETDRYNKRIEELKETLKLIDSDSKSGYNQEQKKAKKLEERYQAAKDCLAIIIDMMNNSPIIEKEMEGLFYSPTSLSDYDKIRERILSVRVE
jgi:hypothetical protein